MPDPLEVMEASMNTAYADVRKITDAIFNSLSPEKKRVAKIGQFLIELTPETSQRFSLGLRGRRWAVLPEIPETYQVANAAYHGADGSYKLTAKSGW